MEVVERGAANGKKKNTLPALLYFHHGSRQRVPLRGTAGGESALFPSLFFSHISCCAVMIQTTRKDH